jgi:hypothetical protein
MSRTIISVALLCVLLGAPGLALGAEPAPAITSGPELASAASGLDGQVVRLAGEVVSEKLSGGEGHVWVNVLSEGTAIGAWMPEELTREIEVFGGWDRVGDRVRIIGTFHEACDQHGGDLDIHAESVSLVRRGIERHRSFALWKLAVGLAGLLVAFAGYLAMRRSSEEGL